MPIIVQVGFAILCCLPYLGGFDNNNKRLLTPFILFSSFPLLLAFDVGGLGFEFCVFVAGWRHALRSEWPMIIFITVGRPHYTWMDGARQDLNALGPRLQLDLLRDWPKLALDRELWRGVASRC